MFPRSRARWPALALAGAAIFFLYFFGLTRAGMLGPDEPRYAAIGRAMAETGDWITPRLWSKPWFEKPALLYWMTAAASRLGLDEDLAPRLPVALLSVAFLAFFWWVLRRVYGERAAWYAAGILGTSAGWLAYSHIGITDLPMTAFFSAAMLLLLSQITASNWRVRWGEWSVAGVLLGLAVLAKGLVPLVLLLPVLWFLRRQWPGLVVTLTIALAVAAPWYTLVTMRNGMPFIDEFFLKHHFARFTSGSLQHVRPWWFFLPVLAGALFPWTPLLGILFRRSIYTGAKEQFLLAWFGFGLIFFSASRNKLPGYLLPVLPAVAALLGIVLGSLRGSTDTLLERREPAQTALAVRWLLAAAASLLWLVPGIMSLLPHALLSGISSAPFRPNYLFAAPVLVCAAAIWGLESKNRRDAAVAGVAAMMVTAVVCVVWMTYPNLDVLVSARPFWRSKKEAVCSDIANRSWRYGLNYYAGRDVPDCNPKP